ncbi:MAG: transglycosylase domain-containing protein [Paracoccaceae bacterium]
MIILKKLIIPLILIILIFFTLFYYTLIHYSKNLPDIEEITKYKPKTISKIYDRDNSLLGLFFDEKREYRKIDKIPFLIRNAFISAEDKNFFKHNGYDLLGYLKAFISFIKEGKLRGASTITQQITKGFLLSGERTFERKIKELILALRLEKALSKNEILEIYLNEVYLGENTYGVVAASKTYFSKDLNELTPGEAAFLAALPKSPEQYSPKNKISNATNRRNFVLKEMFQNGYIDNNIKNVEVKKDLITNFNSILVVKKNYKLLEGFLADEIKAEFLSLFGNTFLSNGSLNINTSIELGLQKKSKNLLISELITLDKKSNIFKPPIFNINTKNYKKKDWEIFFKDKNQNKNKTPWDLGVIAKKDDGNFLLKIKNSEKLINLQFPYEKYPFFSTGDVIYFEEYKYGSHLEYKQIPFFDGGLIILDRDTEEIIVLNGGFNYFTTNINMVTEWKENFKKALVPFLLFIMIDQNVLSASKQGSFSNLDKQKKIFDEIYSDSITDNSNIITINKNHISDLGLKFLTNINKNNLLIENNKITFNTDLTLYDLINYYKLLINMNLYSYSKLIKQVSRSKEIIFDSNYIKSDFEKLSFLSSGKLTDSLIKNEKILEFFNLKKFSAINFVEQINNDIFYGWNTFDEQKNYDLFVGFDNSKIIGCFINKESTNKKIKSNLLHNSCLNLVKKLF